MARRTSGAVAAVAPALSTTAVIARVAVAALERFGRVDVLVTNAGGPPVGLFESHDWSAWQRAVELTLRSAVELTRAVLPGMRERRWGRVIHVTSLAVKQPIDGLMLSTSIRAAVTGFSRTLANEVAADRVTVNTLLPGFMSTERVAELHHATAAREGVPVRTVEERALARIPMRRLGDHGEPRNRCAGRGIRPGHLGDPHPDRARHRGGGRRAPARALSDVRRRRAVDPERLPRRGGRHRFGAPGRMALRVPALVRGRAGSGAGPDPDLDGCGVARHPAPRGRPRAARPAGWC